MASPLLALFARSLREDVRGKMTYAARAALVAVLAVCMLSAILASGWRGAPGLQFFNLIVTIQSVCITLAGLSYFASAITEEKEERMLGLLRMTELNPLSILLGKSTSRLCGALLLLAVQFPFTLLGIMLGGVTGRQIAAAYFALGAYTIFLSNLALLASVLARRTGHAAGWVGAVLATLWLTSTFFIQLANSGKPSAGPAFIRALGAGFEAMSTSGRLGEVLRTGFDGGLFGPQFAFNVGAGLLCFCAAWLVFDRACEYQSAEPAGTAREWLRRRIPPGRAWPRPLVWKDVCFIHGGRGLALLKFAAYGAALAIFLGQRWTSGALHSPGSIAFALFSAAGLGFIVFLVELGLVASRMHRVEVAGHTFSSLALLPCSVRDLHGAKVQSCNHAVLPIAAWTALCFAGGVVLACVESTGFSILVGAPGFAASLGYVLPQVLLYFNLVAWLSLKMPRGALPLGIAAMGVGNLVALVGGFLTCGLGTIAVPIVAIVQARVFREKLLDRLEELTGEG